MADLSDYRKEIDIIDKELMKLFERRMNVAVKVAEYKLEKSLPIFNGERENQVIEKNIQLVEKEEYKLPAKKFLNNIMEISRGIQGQLFREDEESIEISDTIMNKENYKLGFQGVKGSFSEEALHKYFPDFKNAINYEEFEDVFIALKKKEIDFGILPIENSSTGAITTVYDLITKYGFYIVGEECIKIEQHLIGLDGTILENVDEVYSHPQGFEQSTKFLKHYSHWKHIPYHNTAISAKLIRDLNDNTKVAIASKRAADIYGLNIIRECINDESENYTKFIIIGRDLESDKSSNKVSVVFSLEHEVGTLYSLLRHFTENNINMMKIESRPSRVESWKYLLYVDFEGNLKSKEVQNALKLIKDNSKFFRLLGCYRQYGLK